MRLVFQTPTCFKKILPWIR